MSFSWVWMRARHGRDIPACKIRIEQILDLMEVEELLITWVVEQSEWVGDGTERRVMPAAPSAPEVERIVRDLLRRDGTGAFEGGPEDLTRRELDQVRGWARSVLKSRFPKQSAQTWKGSF